MVQLITCRRIIYHVAYSIILPNCTTRVIPPLGAMHAVAPLLLETTSLTALQAVACSQRLLP